MQATGKVWLFYNSQTKKQTKPLSIVHCASHSFDFSKAKELKFIFIWTPGWENWQKLEAFLKLRSKYLCFAPTPETSRISCR